VSGRTPVGRVCGTFLEDGAARRACVAVLCVLVGALGAGVGAARAETQFGSYGTAGGQFREPNGIAVDQQTGDVYVVDTDGKRIEKFSRDGAFQLAWGWGVADGRPRMETCTIAARCREGLEGAGAGELGFAEGVAVNSDPASPSDHDVYVVDIDSYRVEKFSPTGRFLLTFGGHVNESAHERGEASGESVCPVRPGDRCGGGVEGAGDGEFDFRDEGNFIAVSLTSGIVYVGDHNRVQEFSPNGEYLSQVALVPPVRGGGEEGGASALALGPTEDLYVVRYGISGVQEYSPQGQLVQTLDEEASIEGDESPTPTLTVDAKGDVFLDYHVVETSGSQEHHHMIEYDAMGAQIAVFDAGMGDGQHGIAFGDAADRLYVVVATDGGAHVRIVAPPAPIDPVFSSFTLLPWLYG
jgi:hypothetical protein